MDRVTFSRGVKVAGALVALAMIALLTINNLQIGAQLKVVEQQRDFQAQADPLVRDGRILVDGIRDRLPATKRRANDAAELVRASAPLVDELREVLPPLDDAARRTPRFMSETMAVLRETRALLRNALDVQRNTRELQRRSLSVQEASLAVQRETLAIQKEALVHIRSIDRKTGGTVPVQAGG